jgi:hypothetical protein
VASFFKVTLDTTGPQTPTFAIAAGAAVVNSQTTAVNFSTSDSSTSGYQVKIWGNVDVAFNAAIQATEGASEWITYNAEVAVKLSSGDGSKTLHAKIRDDVWNETAELSDSIELDTTSPIITISSGPEPTKVSKISGKRTVTFKFQSDSKLKAWKVKVVPSSASTESAGTLIGVTNGSTNMTGTTLEKETNEECTIDGRDLAEAAGPDGEYTVKVFGQDLAGNWSTA